MTNKQIKAIELLTGHKYGGNYRELSYHFDISNSYTLNVNVESKEIEWHSRDCDGGVKLNWLLPLHQILIENKTKPVYENGYEKLKRQCDECGNHKKVKLNKFNEGEYCYHCILSMCGREKAPQVWKDMKDVDDTCAWCGEEKNKHPKNGCVKTLIGFEKEVK